MNSLPSLGRAIPVVVGPTYGIYADLLNARASEIKQATVETHAYGADPRQQLDLYKSADANSAPIFLFIYGGGFLNGDKILKGIPDGLAYTNLGHFFSSKFGFETIVMDYRLIGHGASYPSGGDDLDGVWKWIQKRYQGSHRQVFIMGNSAGGIHACTWLFEDKFKESRREAIAGSHGVRLTGVITLGAAFTFRHSPQALVEMVSRYLGADAEKNSPMGCIERCKASGELAGEPWPRMLIVDSELDPEDILQSSQDALTGLKSVENIIVDYRKLQGHNHISPPLALGTGVAEEEAWGFEVGRWCVG
jgi:acetyl esterase/lipase